MKILSLIGERSGSQSHILNQFFDYLPEGISETKEIAEADMFFVHVSNGHTARIGTLPNNDGASLANMAHIKSMLGILEKPGILYFDSFGLSRPDNFMYPDFVRDIDIPTAVVEIPNHPNAFRTHFTDERRFYVTHRFEREPKSLMLLKDQFIGREGIYDMLVSLLKKKVLNKVYVAGRSDLDFEYQYNDQIEPISAQWPDGVCRILNRVEFFLSTQPTHGVELMGIEAGFCGAQPIYPDVDYYRAMFDYEDCGVGYWESTESLENILGAGHIWNADKREKFVAHCSGTQNLPRFWEHVLKTIQGDDGED